MGISIGAFQNRLRYGWSEERLLEPQQPQLKMSKHEMRLEILKLRKELEMMMDKIESGKWIKLPCEEMYRVIPNTQSNDFNDEPAYRVLQYKIIAISIDGSKYLVESAGWQGKQNQHWINACEFITKSQAEAMLKKLKGEEE